MQRKEKLLNILNLPEVQAFMREHKAEDIRELALQYGAKINFPLAPVLEWIDSLQRAEKKVPLHAKEECYFTRRSLEQASSEATAKYKADRIQGKTLVNLSGGLGIDDWAFAQNGVKVISLDPDLELNELVKANLGKLKIESVQRLDEKAEEFLVKSSEKHFDVIYADPDRREAGKRLVGLDDCAPPIKQIWSEIQKISDRQVVKLSPLYPLEQLEKELPGLERIEVVALFGEVKEVLAFCQSGVQSDEVTRCAVEISDNTSFSGMPSHTVSAILKDEAFFYEVHPSLSKANLAGTYAQELGTQSILPNGIYQIDDREHLGFFGRGFSILSKGRYSRKQFQQYLKEKQIKKANLASRYFKLSPEELKKLHGLGDGGDAYIFFYTGADGQQNFVHGKKLAYNS